MARIPSHYCNEEERVDHDILKHYQKIKDTGMYHHVASSYNRHGRFRCVADILQNLNFKAMLTVSRVTYRPFGDPTSLATQRSTKATIMILSVKAQYIATVFLMSSGWIRMLADYHIVFQSYNDSNQATDAIATIDRQLM